MARNLTPDSIQALAANKELTVSDWPKADLYYIALNQKDERLKNPKVREALRWLIDYQGMAGSFLKGQFQVQQAFWPAGFPGSLTDTPLKLAVAQAHPLLPETRYPHAFQATSSPPTP